MSTDRVIATGISEAEARAFYDAYGRKLDLGEPFESEAKRRALARANVQPGERALEVGVGCGHALAHLVERSAGLVVGVDLSRTMLDLGRARAPQARLARGSILRLPLPDRAFDLVLSSYLLDLLPLDDVDRALGELARVTSPRGRVVLCGLTLGRSLPQRAVMGLWSAIHRLSPARVGGCRPLLLAPRLEAAGLALIERIHVSQLGVPSEVIVARPFS